MAAGPPTGTVTFLFTDLADSTRLWEEHPEAMREALARHDEILRDVIVSHAGFVVKMRGDGVHGAFATARDAVDAAIDGQLALGREPWGDTGPLRVRMGLHTGTAEERDGDYFGSEVNRAARLMSVANGGQVLCSQATADLARSALDPECVLVDLGPRQLRDLQAPERVFQITHPDLPVDFPALRTLDAFPGNLPLQVTDFVGRIEELDELAKLLRTSRVVTLTGAGGVGKTRLAMQAAAAALPHYRDGAWFVDLASLDDEGLVPSAIATAMGLPESRRGSREEALAGALTRREALVVLDNCEHLVDAVARVVELVVHRSPAITVLATSQEGLGVEGEATFVVRPLREHDAVRLFVDRVEAVRRGFAMSSDNAAAVDELCRRLDGIPLAIELAAARVASMSPAAILDRLDERFRLLGQGRRTARRRHQTLRAAVDWSYALLSPTEQLVFARLAVFAGDFALEAAEAVVADDQVDALDVLDAVGGLVAKSMLHLVERPDAERYRLLETLREYGLERLADRGELDRVQERHASYFLDFAEAAAPHLEGADDLEWMGRLGDELPNLRAAFAYFRSVDDDRACVRLVSALREFWGQAGLYHEAFASLTAALAMGMPEASRERAENLAFAGDLAIVTDRYEEGFALIEESLATSAVAGEPPPSRALHALALAALVQNRSEEALRLSDEGVAVARAGGNPYEVGTMLGYASNTIGMGGDPDRGIELADEAVGIARALGNTHLLLVGLQAGGSTRSRVDPTGAIELLEECFALPAGPFRRARHIGHTWKAVAHVMLREYPAAAHELCVALPLTQEGGEPYQQSVALGVAALVLSRPEPDVALRLLAAIDQQRRDGRFIGAAGDLAAQEHLRDRLQTNLDPALYDTSWTEGRAMSLDDATSLALDELARIAESS